MASEQANRMLFGLTKRKTVQRPRSNRMWLCTQTKLQRMRGHGMDEKRQRLEVSRVFRGKSRSSCVLLKSGGTFFLTVSSSTLSIGRGGVVSEKERRKRVGQEGSHQIANRLLRERGSRREETPRKREGTYTGDVPEYFQGFHPVELSNTRLTTPSNCPVSSATYARATRPLANLAAETVVAGL